MKDVLRNRYFPKPESKESLGKRRRNYVGDLTATALEGFFGRVDAAEHFEDQKREFELKTLEGHRILDYIIMMVDMFPAQCLPGLIADRGELSAEQWVERFEGVKGEARRNNYLGSPKEIDLSRFLRVRSADRESKTRAAS